MKCDFLCLFFGFICCFVYNGFYRGKYILNFGLIILCGILFKEFYCYFFVKFN